MNFSFSNICWLYEASEVVKCLTKDMKLTLITVMKVTYIDRGNLFEATRKAFFTPCLAFISHINNTEVGI